MTLVVEVLRALAAVVGTLLLIGLLALLIDALFGLHTWGLIAVDLAFILLLLVAGWYTLRAALRNLFNPRRVARQIEERLGIRDSGLINSVELSSSPSTASSRALVDRTVQHGEELAFGLTAFEGVDFRRMLKAAGVAFAIVLGLFALYLATPRLFAMVVPRYLDPTGDHPPFNLLDFEIEVTPELIYRGKPAVISAKLGGVENVEQANVVFIDGEQRRRVPMTRHSDGRFVLPIEQAESTREFYIDTPKGRSKRHAFSVLEVPLFEHVAAAYDFPDYTSWPSTSRELDSKGLRALEGTKITLTATSNIPLQSGRLELFESGEKAPQTPLAEPTRTISLVASDDDATVAGEFTMQMSGRYRLTLTAVNGAESLDHLEGSLVSAPDQLPRVAILSPSQQVAAVEDWKIPVEIQATDDIAVSKLVLMVGVNGWGPDATPIEIQADQPTRVRGQFAFDLKELGARVGDVISYYASAYDNHPGGTHFADTPTHVIRVISLEEFKEFERQNYQMEELVKEFEANRRGLENLGADRKQILEELAALQKKLESGEQLSDDENKRLEKLEQLLKEFSEKADALAEQMHKQAEQTQLYDLEQPYREQLKQTAEQLRKQANDADALIEQSAQLHQQPQDSQAREGLRKAGEQFKQNEQPFDQQSGESMEKMEQDLERLQKADNLLAQAERLRTAILQQRDLADRLSQFRDRKSMSPEELKRSERMAKEQELLRQEVENAKEGLKKAAEDAKEKLPKMSAAAEQLCQSLGDMKVGEDQGQAARSARAGDGEQAFQAAESAAKKLESLLSQCQNAQGASQSGDLDGCLNLPRPGIEQSLKQLAQGRSVPGMGQKGQSGAGFAGSQAKMSIYGPHQPTQGQSDARTSQAMGQTGPGGQGKGEDTKDGIPGAETINPAAREPSQSGVGGMRGVPVGYRDQAEAYFRRLAEEK
jgi:hypothetical protein